MMKLAPGELRWDQWVAQSLKEKAQVGYNPLLLSARTQNNSLYES